jgi:hypothetical protein
MGHKAGKFLTYHCFFTSKTADEIEEAAAAAAAAATAAEAAVGAIMERQEVPSYTGNLVCIEAWLQHLIWQPDKCAGQFTASSCSVALVTGFNFWHVKHM